MRLDYSGRKGKYPVYKCTTVHDRFAQSSCQEVRALGLDQEVEQLLLSALAPDQLAFTLAAFEQMEQERMTLTKQWQHRLERARCQRPAALATGR